MWRFIEGGPAPGVIQSGFEALPTEKLRFQGVSRSVLPCKVYQGGQRNPYHPHREVLERRKTENVKLKKAKKDPLELEGQDFEREVFEMCEQMLSGTTEKADYATRTRTRERLERTGSERCCQSDRCGVDALTTLKTTQNTPKLVHII